MATKNRPTIYKKDLVEQLAEKRNLTKTEAEARIDEVLGLVTENLLADKDVMLANFFNFFVKERPAKDAKNPITQEPMVIPATKTILVKMTKPVKDRIQGKK